MRILLLSDPSNPHTIKWANALQERGYSVYVYGLYRFDIKQYNENVQVEHLEVPWFIRKKAQGNLLKIFYFTSISSIRRIIKSFKPDIVHAHYATSYGLLGALTDFHPFFLNIWGRYDIFNFPQKSVLHKSLYKFILSRADKIICTSSVIINEALKFTDKDLIKIPFGVDTEIFTPTPKKNGGITIGITKMLEKTYGIDILLKAFAKVKQQIPGRNIRLKIIGDGSQKSSLQQLAVDLDLNNQIEFLGRVPYNNIHKYHQQIDISVYPSRFETFGVAVLEASSCGNPVIVSDSGGLLEVVENNVTGIIVPPGSTDALADALISLINDDSLRSSLGNNGRAMVIRKFQWKNSVDQMCKLYKEYI